MIIKMLFIINFLFIICVGTHAVEIINYDFNNQSFGILGAEKFWTMQSRGGVNNTPAVRIEYSTAGTSGKALILNVSDYPTEFFIEFDVKIEGPISGGTKFVKLFGNSTENPWNNINNMTFALNYWSNMQQGVSYYGDTICSAKHAGHDTGPCTPTHIISSKEINVISSKEVKVIDDSWGRYKLYVKRADYKKANGEVKVWWEGELRSHITNMESQPTHIYHSPIVKQIQFGGYNDNRPFTGNTWYMWIDNLYVGTSEKVVLSPHPPRKFSIFMN